MELLTPNGNGPYQLPVAQSVRIDIGSNVVTLVAKVAVPGHQELMSIGIPMTASVADDVLAALPEAIALARKED